MGSSVNRPLPVTMPVWRTPMTPTTPVAASGATHSVISMRSTSLIGPTFVSQRNSVPTPRVCSLVNLMATASCIQSTWRSTGSTTCHTSAGVASIST